MNSGMFREKIIIQKQEFGSDNLGQQIEKWVDYCDCYAYANGLSGSEYWEASRANAQNTVVFTVRYSNKIAEINPVSHRIIFHGKIYNIDSVDNVQFRNDTVKIRGQTHENKD